MTSEADDDPAPLDRDVRLKVYEQLRDHGYPPSAAELAATLDVAVDDVLASFARLAEGRALILGATGDRVQVAPPFSAVPTPFWVETPRGAWWGNCAWESLGIPALLETDAVIRTTSGATGEDLEVRVVDGRLATDDVLVHVAVPARRWWEDVRFTCGTLLFFRAEGEVDAWCQARGIRRGGTAPAAAFWELAKVWFTGRFDPGWRRLTPAEARRSFEGVGLRGPFWEL